MINTIKKNPVFASAFYFILTWAGFPIAALISSHVKGISFAAACSSQYMIFIFVFGSIVAAVQTYIRVKEAR